MNTTNQKITTETLQMKADSYSSVIAYGDFVLASFATWSKDEGFGNNAQVYRLAEAPIPGFGSQARGRSECALELIAEADHLFEDAGYAIAWALTRI
ncbi:hypothetical protein ACRQDV_08710 [Actinotignum sp. GS-2025e]|uniref:Nmad4 family putative nucleotide modification protein n=1 Tax=Actinotignum sp. GS-2025e TaxID=3427278 RepID=UPI003F45922B